MEIWVFLAIVILLVLWFIATYNTLVRMRFNVKNAWAQVDVQLKRRYDLIPNLVETCKGYIQHERQTLEKVVQARAAAINAGGVRAQAEADNMLTGALKSLFAVVEAYPDLKANQNMLALQDELASTENNIGSARQHYNNGVAQYNTKIHSIPANIVANMFKFGPEEFFAVADAGEKAAPKVAFPQ